MGAALGELVAKEVPPRPAETCRRVVARHAPWWGFAVYAVFWAFLAVTVFAAFASMFVEAVAPSPKQSELSETWRLPSLIALAVVTPLFARWVVRRRTAIGRLARDGQLLDAEVTNVVLSALAVASGSDAARTGARAIVVVIHGVRDAYYRGVAPTKLADTTPIGTRVRVLGLVGCKYAIVIAPTGDDFLAKYVR